METSSSSSSSELQPLTLASITTSSSQLATVSTEQWVALIEREKTVLSETLKQPEAVFALISSIAANQEPDGLKNALTLVVVDEKQRLSSLKSDEQKRLSSLKSAALSSLSYCRAKVGGWSVIHLLAMMGSPLMNEKKFQSHYTTKGESNYLPIHCLARFGQLPVQRGQLDLAMLKQMLIKTGESLDTPLSFRVPVRGLPGGCALAGDELDLVLTPLQLAVAYGHAEMVRSLLATKHLNMDVHKRISGVGNLLHLAVLARTSSYEMLHYLVDTFPEDMTSTEGPDKLSPFGLAVERDYLDAARLLLQNRHVNINSTNIFGEAPLHLASKYGYVEIVELLINSGAELDKPNQARKTPVQIAEEEEIRSKESGNHDMEVKYGEIRGCIETYRNERHHNLNRPLPPIQERTLENLVLGGGGMKGLAHVAGIDALEQQGCHFRRVAGTSAGAIAGTLYALGYTPKEMRACILEKNLMEFLEGYDIKGFESVFKNDFSLSSIASAFGSMISQDNKGVSTASSSSSSSSSSGFFSSFKEKSIGYLEKIIPIYGKSGLSSGTDFRLWIERLISDKLSQDLAEHPNLSDIIQPVDQPEQPGLFYLTFGELHALIQKGLPYRELAVVITRITQPYASVTLSSDIGNSDWGNVIISDAVRASMSLPGVFSAHQLYKKSEKQRGIFGNDRYIYYADGGFLKNIAFDAFDCSGLQRLFYTSQRGDEDHYHINPQTIALGVADQNEIESAVKFLEDPEQLTITKAIKRVAGTIWDSERILMRPTDEERLVVLNTGTIGTYDFDAAREEIEQLMNAPRNAVYQAFGSSSSSALVLGK